MVNREETPEATLARRIKARDAQRARRASDPELTKAMAHAYYLAHKPAPKPSTVESRALIAEKAKRMRAENPEAIKAQFRRTYARRVEREGAKYLERVYKAKKIYRDRLKREVMDAYGGICYCCGESEIAFLTIDHSRDDGYRDRLLMKAETGSSSNFYKWVRMAGFPQDRGYRVSCFNCNSGRRINKGICPHEVTMLRLLESVG